MLQKGCILAWCICGDRNKLVFEGAGVPREVLAQRVLRLANECGDYAGKIYGEQRRVACPSSNVWKAPPQGVVKLNADAAVYDDGWIGLGVVARDAVGAVFFAATRRIQARWPIEIAECKAIAMAARLGKRYGCQDIILESDCQSVVSRLSKTVCYCADLDSILEDVLWLCSSFSAVAFSHVKRDGNSVAHNLAKFIPFGVEQCWVNHYPSEVAPYVLMDSLSIS